MLTKAKRLSLLSQYQKENEDLIGLSNINDNASKQPNQNQNESEIKQFILHKSQNPIIQKMWEALEEKNQIPGGKLVTCILIIFFAHLIIGSGAELICNLIAFGYPAYESVKVIRTNNQTGSKEWLTYWTVLAIFMLSDYFLEIIMHYVPFYRILKIVFLLHLSQANTTSQALFNRLINPTTNKLEEYLASFSTELNPTSTS